jgi:uncharacterized phiE125 gp8 family phage protein
MSWCVGTLHDYYPNRTTRQLGQEVRHTVQIVTTPDSEPVTIAEAKTQLHIGASDDSHDVEIAALIAGAREQWERDTSTALITRTIEHRMPQFLPAVELTVRPAVSIESIKYIDNNGQEQTVSAADYYLDGQLLSFADSFVRPMIARRTEAVRIRYEAGFGGDSRFCPQLDRQAIKLLIGYYFENRDMMVSDAYRTTAYEALVAKRMRSTYP